MFALGLFCGVVAGAVACWLWLRSKHAADLAGERAHFQEAGGFSLVRIAELEAQLRAGEERVAERDARLAEETVHHAAALAERDAARETLASLQAELAAASARAEEERRSALERLQMFERAEARLRETFAALSSDALRRNNSAFLEVAKETLASFQQQASSDLQQRQQAIDEAVRPIRESLEKFDSHVGDVEKARVEQYASLGEQVKALQAGQQSLQMETANLVKALRTPHVRGQWGEMQLRRAVELAGMQEHCDFTTQKTLTGDDGRQRPDLVVMLPGGRSVVVDAKTPLVAWLEAAACTDDAQRDALLRDHARQVRDHVGRLSGKQYWAQFAPAPDLVVMFLPGEPLFAAALQHDPTLMEHAISRGVYIAGPMTLIALLRMLAYGWSQQRVEESAARLGAEARTLYDRLRVWVEHLDETRKHLRQTVEAFNRGVGSLETRVLVQARRMQDLGIGGAEIPELDQLDVTPRALQILPVPDDVAEQRPSGVPEFLAADAG